MILRQLESKAHWEFRQGIVRVGQDAGCDLVLPHPWVSPHHALILTHEDLAVVLDNDSGSGTWVNERRLVRGRVLLPNDVLRFGHTRILVEECRSWDRACCEKVAAHPDTPVSLLCVLAAALPRRVLSQAGMRAQLEDPHFVIQLPLPLLRILIEERPPGSLLDAVALHPSPKLRTVVAGLPDLPERTVEVLASDFTAQVRKAVAGRPELGEALTASLARDPEAGVRRQLAACQAHPEVTELLLEDPAWEVRAACAGNPRLPEAGQWRLAADPAPEVRAALAGNPELAAKLLPPLATDPAAPVRQAVAGHPRTPVHLLRQLAADPHPDVWLEAAGNPHTPLMALRALQRDGNTRLDAVLAANSGTPSEVLEELGRSQDPAIRAAVAANEGVPPALFRKLAFDPDDEVRARLATNASTPVDVMEILSEDIVAPQLAWNPVAPLRLLLETLPHLPAYQRQVVASRPGLTRELVAALAADPVPAVRATCAQHGADAEVLQQLARDQAPRVRAGVGANQQTPGPLLRQLANDPEEAVREAVAGNPKTPADARQRLKRDPSSTVQWAF